MAELERIARTSWTADAPAWRAAQSRAQYGAIVWLRWRMLVNGYRRKGGAGELIARIVVYPIFAVLALLPTVAAGGGAYYFAQSGHMERIAWLLWATFVLCQIANIQISSPGSTFDPTQLIRFPLSLSNYVTLRLSFGLLTPANAIGTLMSLAIAIGIIVAVPSLAPAATLGLAVFAATNVLFSRMIFAWVDRWMATRRARELFTALIFVFSLGAQWLNVTFNPTYNHHARHMQAAAQLDTAAGLYRHLYPFIHRLPPELTTSSLIAAQGGHVGNFAALTIACGGFGLFFFAVFALRMRTEFRGENLSDRANVVARRKVDGRRSAAAERATAQPAALAESEGRVSSRVAAIFAKELLVMRRNTGVLYSVVTPLVLVLLFAGRLATRETATWIFPVALSYTLLGSAPLSFNSFGLEGAGAQFYFFAPVRLRDVLLAKNLLNLSLALLEIVAVYGIVSYVVGRPHAEIAVSGVCWALGTLLVTTVIGNRRSLASPKQINMARAAGKQASPLSALISMGVLLLSVCVAAGLFAVAAYVNRPWLLLPIFAAFFAVALWAYLRSLAGIDAYAMQHREELFEELCKKL